MKTKVRLFVNTGYRYSAGAIAREEGDENLPLVQHPDRWKGEPGTHAPHLVLEREDKPISTLDLFGPHFVLLVGPDGQHWKDAARSTQEVLHLPLDSYQIGGEAAEFTDLIDAGNTFCDASVRNSFRESYRIEPLSEGGCRVHFTVEVGGAPKVAKFFMQQAMKKEQPQQAARLKSILASRTHKAS